MSTLSRYEFVGNAFVFWLMAVLVITIPIAILYLMQSTLCVQTEVEDAEDIVERWRAGERP